MTPLDWAWTLGVLAVSGWSTTVTTESW